MPQITIDIPSGGLTSGMWSSSSPLAANKHVRHQSLDSELFGPAVSVAALTKDLHICRGATGVLIGLQASINGAIATGADRTVTVDLHKSTGAGAFATVLSSTIGFTNASVLRTPASAVFSDTAMVASDLLRVIVTVSGSASAQATGLLLTLTYSETYL